MSCKFVGHKCMSAMSVPEDLINFDLIETHKENIQPLPSGRSAKALLHTLSAETAFESSSPNKKRSINDAIRDEYETELRSSQDSDDPLDVYDRYVKWTLSAYPSAQATPDARLRQLLERATKAFQSVHLYKNDPRYLKIWLHYIRFFSDAPKEAFAYLSRHGIGENLALFYEEFAAWLETADRWKQADEILKIGVEREARPIERLVRKYTEFQTRYETRLVDKNEPSSPALSAVRPALAAKMDPFGTTDPSAPGGQRAAQEKQGAARPTVRSGKQKLAIFSDANEAEIGNVVPVSRTSNGWDNIGTVAERTKENVIEARQWTGERLRTVHKARAVPKMSVFKDESKSHQKPLSQESSHTYARANVQRIRSTERVFVNLNAVYPNPDESEVELSFEELRAGSRGWLEKHWQSTAVHSSSTRGSVTCLKTAESASAPSGEFPSSLFSSVDGAEPSMKATDDNFETTIALDVDANSKSFQSSDTGLKKVKGVTQLVKTNLDSPTGPRLKRRQAVEPTMTLHTKAATDDILDIFSQPLRTHDPMLSSEASEDESDADDDDYASAGESTGTGKVSYSGDFADVTGSLKTTITNGESAGGSVSPWSDFSTGKHVPNLDHGQTSPVPTSKSPERRFAATFLESQTLAESEAFSSSLEPKHGSSTYLVSMSPEERQPNSKSQRDTASLAQNRLPFMTPILEKTETSINFSSHGALGKHDIKTPSRVAAVSSVATNYGLEIASSPLREVPLDEKPADEAQIKTPRITSPNGIYCVPSTLPTIQDTRCNPVDDGIRCAILDAASALLGKNQGYHKHQSQRFQRGPEIRKFIRSLAKGKSSERTLTTHLPSILQFPGDPLHSFTIRRELGKGAFAPVYLAEERPVTNTEAETTLVAIKTEDPPTAWEFYIMATLQSRLSRGHRNKSAFLQPRALHIFQDEGYLIEEYRNQGTLLDLVNLARSDPLSGQTTLDESVVMYFAIELLRVVGTMHEMELLHGDLKADNCLVRLDDVGSDEAQWSSQYQPDGSAGWSFKGITLIDFGRSIDLAQFRPDVQFIADWKTGQQDCIEMRELKPWTYQVDYFGLAGIIHSLLFGKYIEDVVVTTKDDLDGPKMLGGNKRYRIKEGFKRYWQIELWSRFFDLTLNPLCHLGAEPSKKLPISCALLALQQSMEQWLIGDGGKRNGGLKSNLMRLETRIKERRAR